MVSASPIRFLSDDAEQIALTNGQPRRTVRSFDGMRFD
jgi:hypothetical protein